MLKKLLVLSLLVSSFTNAQEISYIDSLQRIALKKKEVKLQREIDSFRKIHKRFNYLVETYGYDIITVKGNQAKKEINWSDPKVRHFYDEYQGLYNSYLVVPKRSKYEIDRIKRQNKGRLKSVYRTASGNVYKRYVKGNTTTTYRNGSHYSTFTYYRH